MAPGSYEYGGARTLAALHTKYLDMKESADIPRIVEILFQGADAAVEFVPVMNAEDLQKAPSSL